MERNELISAIYTKAKKRISPFSSFGGSDYYHINPTPLKMDDGSVVNVEWIQPSYWGLDVLINYRTDCLKTTKMSDKELEQLLKII